MRVALLTGSTQSSKNESLSKVLTELSESYHFKFLNFGAFDSEETKYNYLDTAILSGMLINSGSVDFVITGCSSGMGSQLAHNAVPGILCGYGRSYEEANLFTRINQGNAFAYPLGLEWGWGAEIKFKSTMQGLVDGFQQDPYPAKDKERKQRDADALKLMKKNNQVSWKTMVEDLSTEQRAKLTEKNDVIEYVQNNNAQFHF